MDRGEALPRQPVDYHFGDLVSVNAAGLPPGLVLLADDLDTTYEMLRKRGLTWASAIQMAPWGRYATFSDPDGNGWVLQEAPVSS